MGYRSDVMILMYGSPQDCEVICNLFAASKVPQEILDWFDKNKRAHTDEVGAVHYIQWWFQDIKWYDDWEHARETLFKLVEAHQEHNASDIPLVIESARMGENEDDNERYATEPDGYWIGIERQFSYPNFFDNIKGE
jgi:hypothetical protein